MLPFLLMKKNTTVIYYVGGAYGTFLEWCLNYFTDPEFDYHLTFNNSGNAHKYAGNSLTFPPQFENYVNSPLNIPFIRIHPGSTSKENSELESTPKSFEKLINLELEILSRTCQHIIVCYYSTSSWIWGLNNLLSKANLLNDGYTQDQIKQYAKSVETDAEFLMFSPEQKLRDYIKSYSKDTIKQWGVDSIDNLELWQLRELLSFSLPVQMIDSCSEDIYKQAKINYPKIKFIEISEFRDNFKNTLIDILDYLELSLIRSNELDELHSQWIAKQYYAFRDFELTDIVKCLVNLQDNDWSEKNITLLDEIFLQYLLRNQGIEIACYNLNKFPTNTKDFLPLLERL